jgi:hypothetical protein
VSDSFGLVVHRAKLDGVMVAQLVECVPDVRKGQAPVRVSLGRSPWSASTSFTVLGPCPRSSQDCSLVTVLRP